jgi:hypothetical protein
MSSSDKCHEGKWQFVRLIDVFFLGPFMILLAKELYKKGLTADWKWQALAFFGITTIAINLYFFLKIAKWL